jgi:peptide/nickel transport system substrate-binding protein
MALDRVSVLRAAGGDNVGTVVNTIEPPDTNGWRDYNVFQVGPYGDSAQARVHLAGRTPRLTLCFPSDATPVANAIRASLQNAGFLIALSAVPVADYAAAIGRGDNTCDLYPSGWTPDRPTGEASIATLLDGRPIAATGNTDLSYYDSTVTDAEIDRIEAEAATDPIHATVDWSSLDKRVMTQEAPLIPLLNGRTFTMYGSHVGGALLSSVYGLPSFNSVYVKS